LATIDGTIRFETGKGGLCVIKSIVFFSWIAICLFPNTAYAYSYDDDTLEIISKVIPRLVLMSSQKNTVQKQIGVCVLYDDLDERDASLLIQKIRKNYPSGIKNYSLGLVMNKYNEMEGCRNSQITFMFDADNKTIANAVRFLDKNRVFSMSYDPNYLDQGVEASLFLGRKVTPYINIGALRRNGIELDNALVQISKIYTPGDGR
jgi:hypothetical protein